MRFATPLSILPTVPTHALTITDKDPQVFLMLGIGVPSAPCLHSGQLASRVHGTYTRQVHDLPGSDAAVSVALAIRKWWCDNPECPPRIFCMWVTSRLPAYARHPRRLTQWTWDWVWTTRAEEVTNR
jgi:transposase